MVGGKTTPSREGLGGGNVGERYWGSGGDGLLHLEGNINDLITNAVRTVRTNTHLKYIGPIRFPSVDTLDSIRGTISEVNLLRISGEGRLIHSQVASTFTENQILARYFVY